MQLLAFLKYNKIEAEQLDLSIDLIDAVLSKEFLSEVLQSGSILSNGRSAAKGFVSKSGEYINLIEPVKQFLRGGDNTLSQRICTRNLLPEGNRFKQIEDLEWWFGSMGKTDMARHLATLFILDIADFIRENVCPHFGVTKYAERIALSLSTFTLLEEELNKEPNLVDRLMVSLLHKKVELCKPKIIGFTVPFPGNLYAALRCGKYLKENYPEIKIVIGGGYINTELRLLSDTSIFNYTDYIIFDDGERPLLRLVQYENDRRTPLIKTMINLNGEVRYFDGIDDDLKREEIPTPDYDGIEVGKYLSLMELPNPTHSLWSNGFWNKMQLARGCYWAKCAFCDTSLPYIANYQSHEASTIVDSMEMIIKQTGSSGFHFIDEAAPPALLRKLSEEIVKRGLTVSWWTNIRFEKSFTGELCQLMAKSGCIALTGGLEVASNRLLALMNKGVTVEQAAISCKNMQDAGIMVHTYLMYGFPTQTLQETIDSLEVVRQLFVNGLIQSGFWHRYAMTCHSPSGKSPEKFDVKRVSLKPNSFANNEVPYIENVKYDYERVGKGLEKSIYNYMHGVGLDEHVSEWFDCKVPPPIIPPNFIAMAIGCKRKR
ncbi:MAG: radical SAM protein [Bacteroidales bacterium]|nr:MAG: radical SAM protein [Bacteroidales bacterium]